MSISRKTNQIYISRDIYFVIEKYVSNQTGKVLFVHGQLNEDMTTVKHCPNFEKIRAILLKEPKLLNAIINTDMDVVESKIGEYD